MDRLLFTTVKRERLSCSDDGEVKARADAEMGNLAMSDVMKSEL